MSEVVGSYTKSYLQTFPAEALYNFKNLDSKEQKVFLYYLAFEFYASGTDHKADISDYFTSIYGICEECKAENGIMQKMKSDLIVLVSKMND